MSYPRLAMRLYNSALLITPEKLEVIEQVFRAYSEGDAERMQMAEAAPRAELALPDSMQRARGGYLRTADGIALIPVLGTLVQRGGFMDAMSGLTSYDSIGAQLAAAVDDPLVRGILLEVDSPGGEANGIFDLGAEIRAAAARKPVLAHANEVAFSGGYVIASAAQELYTPRTGMVGSIGVRMLHVDQSQYDAKRGLVYTSIYAGSHKNDFDPHAPLSDAALADAQAHIDRMYGVFVDHVASMRGIDVQAVRDTEAALLHADQAKSLGMVDGIATLGETMDLLRERIRNPASQVHGKRAAVSSARDPIEGVEMSEKDKTAPVASAPVAAVDDAKVATEASAAAVAKAGTDAKARVQAILQCEAAKDRPQLAAHLAFATDMAPDEATALLAKAGVETPAAPVNALAAAMPANPRVGADAEDPAGGKPRIKSSAEIYQMRAKQAAGGK